MARAKKGVRRTKKGLLFRKERGYHFCETKCIGKNLWLHYPTYFKWGMPLKNKKFPVYSMASRVVFTNQGIPIKNKSELNSNTLREAKFDPLIYSGLDYAIYLKQAIMVDIFAFDGDNFMIPRDYGWI